MLLFIHSEYSRDMLMLDLHRAFHMEGAFDHDAAGRHARGADHRALQHSHHEVVEGAVE